MMTVRWLVLVGWMVWGVVAFASAQEKTGRAVDFTVPLKNLDGTVIKLNNSTPDKKEDPTIFTLGDAAVQALETVLPEEGKGENGQERFERDELARKIYKNKHAVLTAEEIAKIKVRIGKIFTPLIVGDAWRLLDPPQQ